MYGQHANNGGSPQASGRLRTPGFGYGHEYSQTDGQRRGAGGKTMNSNRRHISKKMRTQLLRLHQTADMD